MNGIAELASLAGVPGLTLVIEAVHYIYTAVDEVKVYRQQCKDMSARCVNLLVAFQEQTDGLEGTRAIGAVDEVEATVLRVRNKVTEWRAWSRVKSFVQRGDIKEGIDSLNKNIDMCMHKFNISINLDLHRGQRDIVAIQARDNAELRETLQTMLKNTEDIKAILGLREPVIVNIMDTIQRELHDPSLETAQEQNLREGMWKLHEGSSLLPPLTDLTGQVVRISSDPVAFGLFNDIYAGKWLDQERVALRLPRALGNSPSVQKRFQNEVKIWRALRPHPNVVPLYGIVYIGEHVYSVSPWMDHGNACNYVQNQSLVDRFGLLLEVAAGLEYLHLNNVVHGDLRGANVLISKDGIARLTDFGLSKFLEEVGHNHSAPGAANPRWSAAELVEETGVVSTHSDVWSFGMLILELFTGEQPFSAIPRDIHVMMALIAGQIPARPGHLAASRGLSEGLWQLLLECWNRDPEKRPSMTIIRSRLLELQTVPKFQHKREPSNGVLNLPGILPMVPQSLSSPQAEVSDRKILVSRSDSLSSRIMSTTTDLIISPKLEPAALPPVEKRSSIFGRRRPSTGGSIKTSPSMSPTSPSKSRWASAMWSSSSKKAVVTEPIPSVQLGLQGFSPSSTTSSSPPFIDDDYFPSNSLGLLPISRTQPIPKKSSSITRSLQEIQRSNSSGVEAPQASSSVPPNFGSHFPNGYVSSDERPPSGHSSGSSSRTSVTSASLHKAVKDPEAVALRLPDGTMKAGTLEGLIEAMIIDSGDLRQIVDYRDTFLRSYSAFTDSEEVYKILVRRFHSAESDGQNAQARTTMRYNIIAVLKRWVNIPDVLIDMHILREMKEYALHVSTSKKMSELARDVVVVIDRRVKAAQDSLLSSATLSTPGQPIPRSTTITPADLAVAMTILEGYRHRHILPADYLAHLQMGARRMREAIETHNKIGCWVTKSILRDKLETRVEVLKFFINVAQECRLLRNYMSMAAVANALHSAPITRLKLTWQKLDPINTQKFEAILKLLDPSHNHRSYRDALDSSSKPCVPWTAVHFRDLTLLFRKHENQIVEYDGHSLINFVRYTKFGELMRTLLEYKPPDLEPERDKGPLAYLEQQLSSLPSEGKRMEGYFATQSLALQAQEKRLHDQHVLELNSLGFRTHP